MLLLEAFTATAPDDEVRTECRGDAVRRSASAPRLNSPQSGVERASAVGARPGSEPAKRTRRPAAKGGTGKFIDSIRCQREPQA
jgi:hypothetical protein